MVFTDMPALRPGRGFGLRSPLVQSTVWPVAMAAKRRNTLLDWMFYDVQSLSTPEFEDLVDETNIEGAILVVHPRAARVPRRVVKHTNYVALRAAKGRMLERFTIAGVGSSDVGAAAFARNVADYYGEPVGAIIAGYGVADVLAEALGGWFVLGAANRLMKGYHDAAATADHDQCFATSRVELDRVTTDHVADGATGGPDSDTLLRLLLDKDRTIKTLVGHSKGCLSIAYALQGLAARGATGALTKAQKIRCITTGAVVALPRGFNNVAQFLGTLDWFGGMNSRLGMAHEKVPHAWHHLNTGIPFGMDLRAVLARAD